MGPALEVAAAVAEFRRLESRREAATVRSECAEHGIGTEAPRCEAFLLGGGWSWLRGRCRRRAPGTRSSCRRTASGWQLGERVEAAGGRSRMCALNVRCVSAQSSRAAPARHKSARYVSEGQQ